MLGRQARTRSGLGQVQRSLSRAHQRLPVGLGFEVHRLIDMDIVTTGNTKSRLRRPVWKCVRYIQSCHEAQFDTERVT
jgi:hypothetical protein